MAEQAREPRKLFKYYLEQQAHLEEKQPLFFRRQQRWRVNSQEYATPFSKKGLLRGYLKYGAFAYMTYYYTRYRLFAPSHHGHHDHHDSHDHGHGHGDKHAHGDKHGHGHGHSDKHSAGHGHSEHGHEKKGHH